MVVVCKYIVVHRHRLRRRRRRRSRIIVVLSVIVIVRRRRRRRQRNDRSIVGRRLCDGVWTCDIIYYLECYARRISRQGGGWMEEDMADNKAGAREGTAVTSQQEKSDRQTILPNKPPEYYSFQID